jgi:hypothetical protein
LYTVKEQKRIMALIKSRVTKTLPTHQETTTCKGKGKGEKYI